MVDAFFALSLHPYTSMLSATGCQRVIDFVFCMCVRSVVLFQICVIIQLKLFLAQNFPVLCSKQVFSVQNNLCFLLYDLVARRDVSEHPTSKAWI